MLICLLSIHVPITVKKIDIKNTVQSILITIFLHLFPFSAKNKARNQFLDFTLNNYTRKHFVYFFIYQYYKGNIFIFSEKYFRIYASRLYYAIL